MGVLEAVKQLPEDELVVVGDAVVDKGLPAVALDGLYQLYVLQVPAEGRHLFQALHSQVHQKCLMALLSCRYLQVREVWRQISDFCSSACWAPCRAYMGCRDIWKCHPSARACRPRVNLWYMR